MKQIESSNILPSFNCLPKPKSNGKCSRDCDHFHYDKMDGWPSAQACYIWDEYVDGDEPYYLTDNICKPAIRLISNKK